MDYENTMSEDKTNMSQLTSNEDDRDERSHNLWKEENDYMDEPWFENIDSYPNFREKQSCQEVEPKPPYHNQINTS